MTIDNNKIDQIMESIGRRVECVEKRREKAISIYEQLVDITRDSLLRALDIVEERKDAVVYTQSVNLYALTQLQYDGYYD